MIIHDLKKKQYPHVPGKLPSLRDILAERPPVPRAPLLRQGRQAGGEPADEVGLLRGGIHTDIVLLRSAPRGFTAIPGWGNRRTPRLAASLARSKNLHSRDSARGGYPDEPGDGGGADGAAPAGARHGPAAAGAEGGVPARRAVEVRRGAAALARRLQELVGGGADARAHAAARRPPGGGALGT